MNTPTQLTLTTESSQIGLPSQVAGRRVDATYYEVRVTYRSMSLAYRLHNEYPYGADCMAAFADSAPQWYSTNIDALELPPETIASLRQLWERLFLGPNAPVCMTCGERGHAPADCPAAVLETLLQEARAEAQQERQTREHAAHQREQERRAAIVKQLEHNLDRAVGPAIMRALIGHIELNSTANAAHLVATVRGKRITLSYAESQQLGRHWAIDTLDNPIDGPVIVREVDYSTELPFRQRLLSVIDGLTMGEDES